MTTVFLVMATANRYAGKEPIPLRVFESRNQAEEWQNTLLDYHIAPPELPVEDDRAIWSGYNARVEEWRRGHPAGLAASEYERFGVYELPLGL